ncbi:CRISPR-associated protein (Cas_Cmr5) [Candidatus Thermokryptus mobilis]|uniref:CRISPR type III-B/RAMP module-associated protein Cmr5 n=1 Tax=Candidatus Thermokryptus mobilis TaxID=1643428 RepID=A0A0S4ND06_9BACT|nr:type III-B CRISPR module-associated protein Cmr5 [Candidatus Thermokryptus mobilis]CUU09271.1 CRISPR-associated protein (Cas_Cmr5) [Candidatus Thermokryptus mobilis]
MKNLDKLCAKYGYEFAEKVSQAFNSDAKKAESLLTKALGVLQEQGLYAFALFCESRGSAESNGAKKITEITTKLLNELNLISNTNNTDLLEEIRKDNGLASRLEDLILAIQMLEKSLIYARYHAKALSKSS